MPVVQFTRGHDDTFHHLHAQAVGEKHFTSPTEILSVPFGESALPWISDVAIG
jgi:hypothetical protein